MSEQRETIADRLEDDIIKEKFEDENPIEHIKRQLDENDKVRGFSISRVPTKTHEEFKEIAENMFADDYGMTLAFLVHYYKMQDEHEERINDIVDDLRQDINSLKTAIIAGQNQESESDDKKVETIQ